MLTVPKFTHFVVVLSCSVKYPESLYLMDCSHRLQSWWNSLQARILYEWMQLFSRSPPQGINWVSLVRLPSEPSGNPLCCWVRANLARSCFGRRQPRSNTIYTQYRCTRMGLPSSLLSFADIIQLSDLCILSYSYIMNHLLSLNLHFKFCQELTSL